MTKHDFTLYETSDQFNGDYLAAEYTQEQFETDYWTAHLKAKQRQAFKRELKRERIKLWLADIKDQADSLPARKRKQFVRRTIEIGYAD